MKHIESTSEMKSFLLSQMSDEELAILINNVRKIGLKSEIFGNGLIYIIKECISKRRIGTKNESIIYIQDLVIKRFCTMNNF